MLNIVRTLKRQFFGTGNRTPFINATPVLVRAADDSWTAAHIGTFDPQSSASDDFTRRIEERCVLSEQHGQLPLWSGYFALKNYPKSVLPGATRSSNDVRTKANTGKFLTWLVSSFKPGSIVEIGTAFGVSGMYWLVGIEKNGAGHLYTFEPNTAWADVAEQNLKAISSRYTLYRGTFEDKVSSLTSAGVKIDLAFIDAIHTHDFALQQFEYVMQNASGRCLIAFDDIDFSDEMKACWDELKNDPRFIAAFECNRIGFVEYRGAGT